VATIIFYQKPGCGTNARQRRMLEAAGHAAVSRNLIAEPWTLESLRGFFGGRPVASWFNPASPRIKSGETDPGKNAAGAALALMLDDPLLVRRPLMDVGGQKCAGFDDELVTGLLGGGGDHRDVLACSKPTASVPCADPHQPQNSSRPGQSRR
jgi:nitrogenase-associated protein